MTFWYRVLAPSDPLHSAYLGSAINVCLSLTQPRSSTCKVPVQQGCAIVKTGSRYQYQYLMTLGCNTNININNKRSGFATSIPISIVVQLILQYQYWYENHLLQICNINFNNNIKSLTLAIPITPQYHLILQYLGININICFNNSTIKSLFRWKFYTF